MSKHPAPYSPAVLREIQIALDLRLGGEGRVLDPFGGIGGIHDLAGDYCTVAIEIEPEWAETSKSKGITWNWDARLGADPHPSNPTGFFDGWFDAIVTSPCYGNRMADHHEAKDGSYRRTYRHLLGRPLTEGNAGQMQWGEEYRQLHREVYASVTPLVHRGGVFLLNIKDHVRNGRIVSVSDFHCETLEDLGWELEEWNAVPTPGFRLGANRIRLPERLYSLTKA